MSHLKEDGRIFYTGRTRLTSSGKPAEAWVLDKWATQQDRDRTAVKPKSARIEVIEAMESAVRFLKGFETSGTMPPVFKKGAEYNIGLLVGAIESLKK